MRRQAELLHDAEARLRQQAELALRESEDRFKVLCTAAPVAIFQLDAQGQCVYASPVWEEMTSTAPEDALGLAWADVVSDGKGLEIADRLAPGAVDEHRPVVLRVHAARRRAGLAVGRTSARARSSATRRTVWATSARSRTSPRER